VAAAAADDDDEHTATGKILKRRTISTVFVLLSVF